jgi:hypothetical protein
MNFDISRTKKIIGAPVQRLNLKKDLMSAENYFWKGVFHNSSFGIVYRHRN